MSLETARAIVVSMRAQIASLELQVIALESALGVEPPAPCPHPEEEREAGNFGQPEMCTRCGEAV